jgi:low affinity Fe/Cu permease
MPAMRSPARVSPYTPALHPAQERFGRFARTASLVAGKPAAFLLALGVVLVWAATGPLFDYSDTWQLIINTGTTVVTFLMVFLIQNTQNREMLALQVKLAELIIAMQGAENKLALAEEMTDDELAALHESYRLRAEKTFESLAARRSRRPR